MLSKYVCKLSADEFSRTFVFVPFIIYLQLFVLQQKLSMMVKIMYNPRNACHRNFVNENYGVDLPIMNQRQTAPVSNKDVVQWLICFNIIVTIVNYSPKQSRQAVLQQLFGGGWLGDAVLVQKISFRRRWGFK